MSEIFRPARAKFTDINGDPLVRGKIEFYDAGTVDPRIVYYNDDMTEAGTSLRFTGDGGLASAINVGNGLYKYITYKLAGRDDDGEELFVPADEIDNIPGGTIGTSYDSNIVIDTVVGLRSLEPASYDIVKCLGHTSTSDGGGGTFIWNDTLAYGDDNGAVIVPLGSPATGRWVRIFKDNTYDIKMWGCVPSVSDSSGPLQYAITYCTNNNVKLTFSAGTIDLNTASVVITCASFIENDCVLDNATLVSFTGPCECVSLGYITDNLFISNPIDGFIRPEWYGCSGDMVDHTDELNICLSNLSNNKILFSKGSYVLGDSVNDITIPIVPTFINDAILTIYDTELPSIAMGEITNLTGRPVIYGRYGIVELENGTYNSTDFDIDDSDDYINLTGLLSNISCKFNWIGEYTLPSIFAPINDEGVIHNTTKGVLSLGDNEFRVTNIITDATYSFNISGLGYVSSANKEYNLNEFVEDYSVDASAALTGAIYSAIASKSKLVGSSIYAATLTSSISFTEINYVELENVKITIDGSYDIALLGSAGSRIIIKNCQINSTDTSNSTMISASDGLIDNCIFSSSTLSIISTSQMTINNNYFSDANLSLFTSDGNIEASNIHDNRFVCNTGFGGFVYINGSTSSSLVKGLVITDNWFEGESGVSGTPRIAVVGAFNTANNSHKASIKNNNFPYNDHFDIVPATEGSFRIGFLDTANTWVADSTNLVTPMYFDLDYNVDKMIAFGGNSDEELLSYQHITNMVATTYDSTPEVVGAYPITFTVSDREVLVAGTVITYTLGKIKTDGLVLGTRQPMFNYAIGATSSTVTGTYSWATYLY